ncbi:hypothetical protein [Vibrio splendidus]|uniref:hypothetical protein n=1 Tax=Vibrio splendidus TaxID=29497 RepID=UPI000D3B5CE2|nr:hypothetical protein [Vibrio splendidus]PTP52459.1 hypothetical protein CWO05_14840 [Vibrio splendidus]
MCKSILTAFGGSASDSMSSIIAQAMVFRLNNSGFKDDEFYLSDESYDLANIIIGQLGAQTKKLRAVYLEIEQSEVPERHFDDVTIDELVVADGYIRGFEMILSAQCYDMSHRVLVSETSVMQTMKKVRIATSKLRRAVDDLMSIKRQLRIASKNKYENSLEITSDDVTKLKVATEASIINCS